MPAEALAIALQVSQQEGLGRVLRGLAGQRLEALAQLLLEAFEVGGDDLQKALGGHRGGLRALAVGQVLRGQAQHVTQLAEERPAAL